MKGQLYAKYFVAIGEDTRILSTDSVRWCLTICSHSPYVEKANVGKLVARKV